MDSMVYKENIFEHKILLLNQNSYFIQNVLKILTQTLTHTRMKLQVTLRGV